MVFVELAYAEVTDLKSAPPETDQEIIDRTRLALSYVEEAAKYAAHVEDARQSLKRALVLCEAMAAVDAQKTVARDDES